MNMKTNPKVDRVFLGVGLTLLVLVEFDRSLASERAKLLERSVRKCQPL